MGQTSSYVTYDISTKNDESPHDHPQDRKKEEYVEPEPEPEPEPPVIVNKVNISALPIEELRSHLNDYIHMTKYDVRNIAATLNFDEDELMEEDWYQQPSSSINIDKNQGTITKSDNNTNGNDDQLLQHQQQLHSRMEMALHILKLSPEIKSLRFKLVPAKLSEYFFWAAVFFILENCSPDDLGTGEILVTAAAKCSKMKNKDLTNNNTTKKISSIESKINNEAVDIDVTKNPSSSQINGGIYTNNTKKAGLQSIIQQKDEELTALRIQLTTARNESTFLKNQMDELKAMATPRCHSGKWIMSKESNEFLALEEEIKQKLRDGKQKRLQELLDQMKFILDSDDVKDSYGKWDCCEQSIYDSSCHK